MPQDFQIEVLSGERLPQSNASKERGLERRTHLLFTIRDFLQKSTGAIYMASLLRRRHNCTVSVGGRGEAAFQAPDRER